MLAFGLWWLGRAEASARKSAEGYGADAKIGGGAVAADQFIRERATSSHAFDPAEIPHGQHAELPPPIITGIDPALMHRIAVVGSGTLDSLPHNGAVVTLLAVCGSTHRKSYFDMAIVGIVGPIIALAVVIVLGSAFGSF
jgi:hypothetical protein